MCGPYALTTTAEVLAQLLPAAITYERRYRDRSAPMRSRRTPTGLPPDQRRPNHSRQEPHH